MAKYAYPAIFTKEGKLYSVIYPDLEGCYTCGDDLYDAIYMAEDVLALTLYEYEREAKEIPEPSTDLKAPKGSFVNYIACDTLDYHRRNNNRAVKKTLTIPEWLNEEAMEAGLNFSQILQEALKIELGIYS